MQNIQTFEIPRPASFPDFGGSPELDTALATYITTNQGLLKDHLVFASTLSTRFEDLYLKLSLSFGTSAQVTDETLRAADQERLRLVGDMRYIGTQITTLEKIRDVFSKSIPVAIPNSPYVTLLATIEGLKSRITSATKKEQQLNVCINTNRGQALSYIQIGKAMLLASTDLEKGTERKPKAPPVKPKPKKETSPQAPAAATAVEPPAAAAVKPPVAEISNQNKGKPSGLPARRYC